MRARTTSQLLSGPSWEIPMTFRPSKRLLVVNLLSAVLVGAVLVLAPYVLLSVTRLFQGLHLIHWILLGLGVVWALIFSYVYFHFFTIEYEVNESYVVNSEGLFWRSRRSTPVDKITNVDIRQGPLERFLGISQVWIFTPSTGALTPEVRLLGLEDAPALKSLVLAKAEKRKGSISASASEPQLSTPVTSVLEEILKTLR